MPNALRLIAGLVVVIGVGFAIRYQYEDTMAKATTMKPADLGINEANGWKPVEVKFRPIDMSQKTIIVPTPPFPSKR